MKPNLTILASVLAAILSLPACVMAADATEYKLELAKTKAILSDAESKAQLWTTSDALLEDAEKAASSGNFSLAVKLVKEAGLHGELAVATAEREKKTWQKGVPK